MRRNFGVKTWLYPMPVLIVAAYDENGEVNAMNAAWGGIHTDDMIGICLSEEHKTTKNILSTRAFTVSMATAEKVAECDYVGIVSGNKVPDKFSRAGFTAEKSEFVNAPIITQLPPVLLKTHIFNFAKFNRVKFLQRDFVDRLGYDNLLIENLH